MIYEMLRTVVNRMRLATAPDRATYLVLQQEIAQQLQVTVRNVRHLVRAWQSAGVAGIIRQGRLPEGELASQTGLWGAATR